MVNYGVSRACGTCRERHKKCDGTRPICLRCQKSNRSCYGYAQADNMIFRNYSVPSSENIVPSPTTPQPWVPDLSDIAVEQRAAKMFLRDYVSEPVDPRYSRGFLSGLSHFIGDRYNESLDRCSDIVGAAAIVTLAGAGNRLESAKLKSYAAHRYGLLLRSFQKGLAMHACPSQLTVQDLIMAVLLGLYEIVSSSDSHDSCHSTHVHGVCAILRSDQWPSDFKAGLELFQLSDPMLLNGTLKEPAVPGVLWVPSSGGIVASLDSIMIKCRSFFDQAELHLAKDNPYSHDLEDLLQKATIQDKAFRRWADEASEAWKPHAIYNVAPEKADQASLWPCRSGPVEVFGDLYIGSVWNTYRKTHLMLLDILIRTSARLKGTAAAASISQRHHQVNLLAAGIAASIPFFMAGRISEYLEAMELPSAGQPQSITLGPPVGGLLLLHPLYVASICSTVETDMQEYFSSWLALIGNRMGIGQATLLSKKLTEPLPFQEISEGHMIIWAGMLIKSDRQDYQENASSG